MAWRTGVAALALALWAVAGLASAAPGRPVKRAPFRVAPRPPPAEPPCHALTPAQLAGKLPYGPGEALSYDILLNGAGAGRLDIRMEDRVLEGGRLSYPARVSATSTTLVSIWAKLAADLVTYVEPDRTLPLRSSSTTRTDRYTYQEEMQYDRAAGTVTGNATFNGKKWNGKLSSDTDALDPLSLLFYARSRDLTVGQAYCMEMYQGQVMWRIRGKVTGLETVQTDAGPFQTFVTSGAASIVGRQGAAAQTKTYTAYMTTDEDRIPVLLNAPTPWGAVTAKLVRFEQGRRLTRAQTASTVPARGKPSGDRHRTSLD
jgi:hypothetical protein